MDFSSLLAFLDGEWMDEVLVWAVAALAGGVGLVALVNAVDMFFEADADVG